jgi:hypothetical protein
MLNRAIQATMPSDPTIVPPTIPTPQPDVPDIPDSDIPVEEPTLPGELPPITPDITDPPLTPADRPYQL